MARRLEVKARTLESLRGKVVVIRSFTHTCPSCAGTMPALEKIAGEYAARRVGLR